MAKFKYLVSALKTLLKRDHDEEDKIFMHESYSNAELPGEFRFNMQSAFGCALFLVVILVLNILIFILVKV